MTGDRDPADVPVAVRGELTADDVGRLVASSQAVSQVQFAFDNATLSPEQKTMLEQSLAWLRNNPKKGLIVVGHAGPIGTSEYNMHLAQDRATAVMNHLIAQGIEPARLRAVTHGEAESDYVGVVDPGSKTKYTTERKVILYTDPADAYDVNKDSIKTKDWY